MKISVIGAGHVGLVTGACFADLGNQVVMTDDDHRKIALLKRGRMPFYEPGLQELVRRGIAERRLSFTLSLKDAVDHGLILFICVGTPARANGEADLSAVEQVARGVAKLMRSYRLIVEKSTVPVETGEWIKRTLRLAARRNVTFDVASNPEFLREGQGIHDCLHPDRIILGVESKQARQLLTELYAPLNAPLVITDIKSAELIKHASNSFLALKISFINMVAQLCEAVGADAVKVADGMGLDRRIGRSFLNAGVGYGGYCFPKDISAFIRIAEQHGIAFNILKAATEVNEEQRRRFVARVAQALWNLKNKTIAVLGLAFKPDTDDVREAPSVDIIRMLQKEGAKVRVFDPKAAVSANGLFQGVTIGTDVYATARGADCLALVTEWNEFKELDFARLKKLMRQPVIVDGRNVYDPEAMRKLGFQYFGMGRGYHDAD